MNGNTSLIDENINIKNLSETYITVREASEILRVSTNVVYKLIRSGKIKAVKSGRFWYVSYNDVLKYKLNNPRVLIYARVSSDSKKYLLDEQVNECLAFAKRKGWKNIQVLKHVCKHDEIDSIRLKLLEMIYNRDFDILLVRSIDRISWNEYIFALFVSLCIAKRIEIYTVSNEFIYDGGPVILKNHKITSEFDWFLYDAFDVFKEHLSYWRNIFRKKVMRTGRSDR